MVGDVVELEEQDAITSLHLQVAVLVLRKLGGRIDVHPCRHVLVETVVFVDIGGVVSESGYALLAVVLGDALQQFLHRLGADEELFLIVVVYDCNLHYVFLKACWKMKV